MQACLPTRFNGIPVNNNNIDPLRRPNRHLNPRMCLPKRPLRKQTLRLHPHLPPPKYRRLFRSALRAGRAKSRPLDLLLLDGTV